MGFYHPDDSSNFRNKQIQVNELVTRFKDISATHKKIGFLIN